MLMHVAHLLDMTKLGLLSNTAQGSDQHCGLRTAITAP